MRKFRLLTGIGVLACAGAALGFGLAGPVGADTGTSTDLTTTATTTSNRGKHSHGDEKGNKNQNDEPGKACRKVVLWGSGASGIVTSTVTKAAGRSNSGLVGKPVTLTIPAGSVVHAVACADAAGASLTLKQLVVQVAHPSPAAKPSGS